jgi:cell division protease FtsH
MSEKLGAVKFGQESGEVFLGRDMGHQRDYSEEVAAQVDAEVRTLVEAAHHEAWEILVQYRDVLDEMVLQLLEKETLTKDEVAQIFAPVKKRSQRKHPTANGKRPLSDRPPVLTPAELATLDASELDQLARGRRKAPARRTTAVRREAKPTDSPRRAPRRRPGADPA